MKLYTVSTHSFRKYVPKAKLTDGLWFLATVVIWFTLSTMV